MSPKAEEMRRPATQEEIEAGADQILEAHLRMEGKIQSKEELPVEDRKQKVAKGTGGSSKQSAGVDKRKSRVETQERAPRNSSPGLTAQPKPELGSTSTELRTPGDQAKREGKKEIEVREEQPQERRIGDERESEKRVEGGERRVIEESSQLPPRSLLFTPEQLQHMNQIYDQAPWLYGTSQSAFTPFTTIRRPSFLEHEEGRLSEEERKAKEAQAQLEFWKNTAREQQERDELRRTVQEVMKENAALRRKIEEMDGKLNRGDQYLTPDSHRRFEAEEREEEVYGGEEEQEESEECGEDGRDRGRSRETDFTKQSMKFMMLMMETMKEFQKSVGGAKEEGLVRGVEMVRTGVPDLPLLPPWDAQTGPLQLGDWLLLVEPIVSDLSITANEWWKAIVKAAEEWYRSHISMSPLERVKHDTEPPKHIVEERWQRVERRTSAMLLQAVPQVVRDELVSARRMGVFGILTYLMTSYCPGGVSEKQMLLRNLEEPPEIGSVSDAPAALRKWMRWRYRTKEVGAVAPDPSLQLKGLLRMTRKILDGNRELQFRVSLVRSGLGIDTTPTDSSVEQFATHLLAEIEQLALAEKRSPSYHKGDPKIKYLEVEKGEKGKGKGKEKGEEENQRKCKFYLSEGGCRKGKECKWSHDQRDEKRRCFNCGSPEHLSPACTRPRQASPESLKKNKAFRGEVDEKQGESMETDTQSVSSSDSTVKDLLAEANKMLKSLTSSDSPPKTPTREEEIRNGVMERLQQQLNAMKQKAFRLHRMTTAGEEGLIDSGATHPLRPLIEGEDTSRYREVEVTLANGEVKRMPMSPGFAMVSDQKNIEPIVPMGLLADLLGCKVIWKSEGLEVLHPKRGQLPVRAVDGCPQIPKTLALGLIEEMEMKLKGVGATKEEFEKEAGWIKQLLETHPVLKELPEEVKSRLFVSPGEWGDLPANKRTRKKMRREGFAVHLYAGPDRGFTLKKAWEQVYGKPHQLLEVDKERGSSHDMLLDKGVYSGLMRAAMEGKLLAVVGGPNCRTRSILRHRPIPENPQAPRPVRRWGGEEHGIVDITPEEKKSVVEDDILLWRMVVLYMVAEYTRKARMIPYQTHFGMEQPASPKEQAPEVVSFWDTTQWNQLKKEFGWKEVHFDQGRMGGLSTKRTTMGGSLDLNVEDFMTGCPRFEKVKNSKDLSRWAPGLMSTVSRALMEQVFNQPVMKQKALTWEEHIAFGHVPYRRDCRVCQEALQQCAPHRKVKEVIGGVLSVDTAGPLIPAYDMGGKQARWMLVGVLAWRVPKDTKRMKREEDQEAPEDAPRIDAGHQQESKENHQLQDGQHERGEEDLLNVALGNAEDAPRDDVQEGHNSQDEEVEEEQDKVEDGLPAEQGLEETELRCFRLCLPMITKTSREVTATVMEFVLRLRTDGYHVGRIHSDRGHEFSGEFVRWARTRGIHLTKTPGDDPRSNGRAEVTVKQIKEQVRRTLRQAEAGARWWPWAVRYVSELNRYQRLDKTPDFPPFMKEVSVKKRTWRQEAFEVTVEKVNYLCPSAEDHGHWIVKGEERPRVTKLILASTVEPMDHRFWGALEEKSRDAFVLRRRLRGKTSVRRVHVSLEEDEHQEGQEAKQRVEKVIQDELQYLVEDDPEIAAEEVKLFARLRKMVEDVDESEEVLQTKIISPKEVSKKWEEWLEAVNSEYISLTEEKEALKKLSKEEVEMMKKEAERKGKGIEVIPSKLVCTLKPAPKGGKRKIRWVACGNLEPKKEGEENFSGGADATAFRALLFVSAKQQWKAFVLDVRTAFLNAEMKQTEAEDLILIKPPYLLIEKGYLPRDALFLPLKALYGFRRSPKLWGDHRDHLLRQLVVQVKGTRGAKMEVRMEQMRSEPNLWKIVQGVEEEGEEEFISNGKVKGLLMTYVDDLCVSAQEEVAESVVRELRKMWKTSEPEEIGKDPVRFLGMNVKKFKEGEKEVWYVTQEPYIQDLLGRYEDQVRKIPITRDQAAMEPEKGSPTLEEVRRCQKEVGEVLWVVTRSRPDLMYAVARMGANVTKAASKVLETASQVRGYLKKTKNEGLCFSSQDEEAEVTIQAFSDSSFAPESEESHGSFIIMADDVPLFWRSGRQSLITVSTAESELAELTESMTAGESVAVLIEELYEKVRKVAWCDNQAAITILVGEGGSWRTRHLRMRSLFAKQAVVRGEWQLAHLPGERMIADIGTKALTSTRLDVLKGLMGMRKVPSEEEEGVEDQQREGDGDKEDDEVKRGKELTMKKATAVKLLIMAAQMSLTKASEIEEEGKEEEDSQEGEETLHMMVFFYTVVVVLFTILVQRMWKVGVRWMAGGSRKPSYQKTRSLPAESDQEEESEESFEEVSPKSEEEREEGNKEEPSSSTDPVNVVSTTAKLTSTTVRTGGLQGGVQQDGASQGGVQQAGVHQEGPPQGSQNSQIQVSIGFNVLVTKFGKVYHTNRDCSYLKSPQTGMAPNHRWCSTCEDLDRRSSQTHVAGAELRFEEERAVFHTNSACPHFRWTKEKKACSRCVTKRG